MKNYNIVFTGGGTGGHIFPGLAVAEEFKSLCSKKNVSVRLFWIGNSSGLDRTLIEKNSFIEDSKKNTNAGVSLIDGFYGIPAGKLRRCFSVKNFFDLFKVAAGVVVSFFILARIKPVFIFSKGGFVSVPPCIAAFILKIPVYTHECDFTPGLATRINSSFAKKVFISYRQTANFFRESIDSVVTGNPVRPVFYNANAAEGRKFLNIDDTETKPILLVLGGSLGAKQLNCLVEENLEWLCKNFIVIHQCGNVHFESIRDRLSSIYKNLSYKPFAFIYEQMPDVIAASSVIFSRAGANSLWEAAVLSKPMVLLPLSGSGTRGDQKDNAEFFKNEGAAIVLSDEKVSSEGLEEALTFFMNEENRKKASAAAKRFIGDVKPAEKIAEILYNESDF